MPDQNNHQLDDEYSQIRSELRQALQSPHKLSYAEAKLNEVAVKFGIRSSAGSRRLRKLLESTVHEIKLKWPNTPPQIHLYSSLADEQLHPLEVAMGVSHKAYICYQAALFLNELSDQVPNTLHVGIERPKTSSKSKAPELWDDFVLRDAFAKPPRPHKKVALFGNQRIVLLERAYSGNAGVESRTFSSLTKGKTIHVTGLERTLLDCAISPEDAGGISNVIDAFAEAANQIDIQKMIRLYRGFGLKYPHWQRIAFILKHFTDSRIADKWMNAFGKPKNKFYAMKGYKLNWRYDDETQIYYPPGLLK